jgi:hypothetical protein
MRPVDHDVALLLMRGHRIRWQPSGDAAVREGYISRVKVLGPREREYEIQTGARTPHRETTSSLARKGFEQV